MTARTSYVAGFCCSSCFAKLQTNNKQAQDLTNAMAQRRLTFSARMYMSGDATSTPSFITSSRRLLS